MSNVLIIESSARQQDSISRQLTQQFISQWQAVHPADQITVRDVAQGPARPLRGQFRPGPRFRSGR